VPDVTYQPRHDALSRLYREQVDVSLLRENLRLTVEGRLERLMALQRFAHDLREAGRRARASAR
jgi:hypothetical protein